jgi:hypothetical protein
LGRGSVEVHGGGGGGQFAELGEWEIVEGADAKEVKAVVEARRCRASGARGCIGEGDGGE